MKQIIGMIHLQGGIDEALREVELYEKYGLAGALVENYHAGREQVEEALKAINKKGFVIDIGVNILPNEYREAFRLAEHYDASFIQLDQVAGNYAGGISIDTKDYLATRARYPDINVLGGVWPKYYQPAPGSRLEDDIKDATKRCDVLVVTGSGTGVETPLEKIKTFRTHASDQTLYIGAGMNAENATKLLEHADGAIIGSYFKGGNTAQNVQEELVKGFMKSVRNKQIL